MDEPPLEQTPERELQPLLHDLATAVVAPALVLASRDGQVRRGGVSGWYVGDVRLLDHLELAVEDSDLDLVRSDTAAAARHEFGYVARGLGDVQPDPTVQLDRVRELAADRLEERVVVTSTATTPLRVSVSLAVGGDLLSMPEVKQGRTGDPLPADVARVCLSWGDERGAVDLVVTDGEALVAPGRVSWTLELEPGGSRTVGVRLLADAHPVFEHGGPPSWAARVQAPDPRLPRLVDQSLTDLAGLLLRDGSDRFLAAGSPWFLTLFGRDSLWAARLLLPVDPALALSTLRVLARRQGRVEDPATEEQPGKILHEIRTPGLGHSLPPVYYGTVDATALFVTLLADAHRWGADPQQVRELLPAARRCLRWIREQSARTGWLTYVDLTGTGLSNQGWKDSHDSVQFADGRLADPPIALCEVQAYAYEAAVAGAALLAAHDEPAEDGLLEWAEDLRTRFRRDFWVSTPEGGHPAIALDRDGRQVDSLTSNLGHLLGTGILTPEQVERVAGLLVSEELCSGFGLRTLSDRSPRFSRVSYHGGTVWPHDTAIAVRGLAAEGRLAEAATLTAGLVRAAEGFEFRLPELYGGDDARAVATPSAYPAACRPQAWAAAAPVAALVAVSGLHVDATGRAAVPESTSTALGPYRLSGLRAGDREVAVEVGPDGRVTLT